MRFPRATIDSDALRHNLGVVRRTAPASRVIAVIKANAYGHGLVPAARALASADALGVARLKEGLALRSAGVASPIVLLEGVFSADELAVAERERFEVVVHSFEQVAMLEAAHGARVFDVWLKCDTGMNRLGFRAADVASAWDRLVRCACVRQVRWMTHLAAAEDRTGEGTPRQLAAFGDIVAGRAGERSIANSAGLVAWRDARADWVRPGLMLYGISPFAEVDATALGLKAAMTFETQLIAIRQVAAGEAVGYNGIWRAAHDAVIGIAAIGYGDGYPRNVSSGAPVLVEGRATSVVGRVSMDMTAIDLTDVPGVSVGDTVILWGTGVPVERVAPYCGTIPYELVCGISDRVDVEWV